MLQQVQQFVRRTSMIKDLIREEEREALAGDGFVLEYKRNMLTIRGYLGEPKVEIIYFGEGDILISSEEEFQWVSTIKSIISAFGDKICIAWGNKDEEAIVI